MTVGNNDHLSGRFVVCWVDRYGTELTELNFLTIHGTTSVQTIEIGESAIEMNCHFPCVHRYVALAQKAQGDPSSAIATMIQETVLFEAPWDEENIEANKN